MMIPLVSIFCASVLFLATNSRFALVPIAVAGTVMISHRACWHVHLYLGEG